MHTHTFWWLLHETDRWQLHLRSPTTQLPLTCQSNCLLHTHTHTHMHSHTSTNTQLHTCTHTHTITHTHAHTQLQHHTHIHAHLHQTHMHTLNTHTCIISMSTPLATLPSRDSITWAVASTRRCRVSSSTTERDRRGVAGWTMPSDQSKSLSFTSRTPAHPMASLGWQTRLGKDSALRKTRTCDFRRLHKRFTWGYI